MTAPSETPGRASVGACDTPPSGAGAGVGVEARVRRGCALVVASVAAYASYVHQREFALQGGADVVSATLWPLSVDGLLLLATVGLLNSSPNVGRRARAAVWLAFLLGIAVSLAANVAAAPALAWKPMLVAGWPPVALLLSVELLVHRSVGRRGESPEGSSEACDETRREGGPQPDREARGSDGRGAGPAERDETETVRRESGRGDREPMDGDETGRVEARSVSDRSRSAGATAEVVMWEHFRQQLAAGHTPTGAELDRVAGTNNYGRAVLARWRRTGRIPEAVDGKHLNRALGHS
ncbi:DUF2637 domain-containing protein [Streptomyces sp. 3213.3]|uniref:DUF2637 domain-containing protein n=1 Tax=Streptomyces sp. 3213.3 TaxID=1855348 RepID=UPI002E12A8E2